VSFEALGPVSFAPRPPVVPRLEGVPGPARPVVPSPPAVSSFSASLASALAAASPGAAASTGPMTPATGVAAPPATGVAGPSTTAAAVPATAAGAIAAPSAGAAPGSYPNLTGDLDASPEVLTRLDRMAAARGERWTVTSGLRTDAEQAVLWANRASNPYPVARPGTSIHRTGQGADVTIGGRPIQDVIPADALRAAGLEPLVGDAVHVQLAGTLN
jgi:hypothetical protein